MTPRTPAQNQALRAATRARILDGALKAFSRHGFEGASISLIAKEAGVAQGLLYSHFEGKDDLLRAIFGRSLEDVRESFMAAAGDDSIPPLERLIRSAFSILRRNLGFWKLSYGIRMQEPVLKTLGSALQDWSREISETLEAHFRAAGADRPAVEAAILFAAIDGISQHYALDPARYPLDAVADGLIARYARTERGSRAERGPLTEHGRKQAKPKAKGPMTNTKPYAQSTGGNHGPIGHRIRDRKKNRRR
jgi:AcrR family transcriptional regulator